MGSLGLEALFPIASRFLDIQEIVVQGISAAALRYGTYKDQPFRVPSSYVGIVIVLPPPAALLTQCIPSPLIRPQKDGTPNTDPRHSRPNPPKQSPPSLLPPYPRQDPPRPLPFHNFTLLPMLPPGQHQIRLQHVQWRRQPRRHRASQTPKQRTLRRRHQPLFPLEPDTLPLRIRSLEVFPQTELYDGEGDLAHHRHAAAAVELSDHGHIAATTTTTTGLVSLMAESEDVVQSAEGGAVEEAGLGALLDHFGWDADCAGGDFAEGGGEHMDCRGGGGGLCCGGG